MLLYTENPLKFAFSHAVTELSDDLSISQRAASEKKFGILGVPFDGTGTYLPGARFGPNSVREASYNLERYNLLLRKNLETRFYDVGNLEVVPGNFNETSKRLESTVEQLSKNNIAPITIGGEHIVTLGIIQGLVNVLDIQDVTIIQLDAHLDLRDQYQGEKYSHATVMRRIWDLNPKKMVQIGVRSGTEEEVAFAHDAEIEYYSSPEVKSNMEGIERLISNINGPLYVTVDIDVLDPAYAPSVGTPVPNGLEPGELQRLIYSLQDKEMVGLDVVEVSSNSIGDITSVNGAQIIYDFLCLQ